MSAAIEIDRVSKEYPSSARPIPVLDSLDLDVQATEFVCLLGPSGCGKSTLLSMIGGLVPPTSGEVRIGGRKVVRPPAEVVTVFQDYALFPWRTVLGNVEYGLQARGVSRAVRRSRASDELRAVGLEEFAASRPHELSGGMRQRVGIARALAVDPAVVLMDEPFAALDAVTRMRMQGTLEQLWSEKRPTVVFVTHDIDEAVYLADRICLLGKCPCRAVEEFHVRLPRPRDRSSPAFFELRARILRALHLAGEPSLPEYEI